MVADAILCTGSAMPGYAHAENNYTSIQGGFAYPHVSPHLKGNVPAGGNLGFKDGHVDWRGFQTHDAAHRPVAQLSGGNCRGAVGNIILEA